MKSLEKRACLSEGSARVVEAYKVEVASLTSERADLRAQVRHLSEDPAMHRSDLKKTLTTKSQAEEQDKKARYELRAAVYELRMVKDELQISREELKTTRGELRVVNAGKQVDNEELQAVRDELRLKTMTLSLVFQEVSEAESTVGHLNDECRGESESNGDDDLGVSSAAPSSAFLLGDPMVEAAQPPSSNT